MNALKFIARWIGPALVLLGIVYWLHVVDMTFPFSILLPCVGAVITLIAWSLTSGPERRLSSSLLVGCALLGILFAGWQYWDQASHYRELTVNFNSKGAQLAGTLFLPNVTGKVPGVVMVHGSGSYRRWIFKRLGADHFARAGYAVLIYDKRGVGDSSGHYEGDCNTCPNNLELLASDASAALSVLAARPEVDGNRVGYWGWSQAGWVVPKAAAMNRHAAFMLLVTAPATSVHQNMRYERFTGAPIFIAKDNLTPDQAEILAARANQQFNFPDSDPAVDLQRLTIPALWILGDRDGMVPPGKTIEILQGLIKKGKPYEYQTVLGAGHGILSGEQRREYWEIVDTWLARVTAR